jgi:hypothetical protein
MQNSSAKSNGRSHYAKTRILDNFDSMEQDAFRSTSLRFLEWFKAQPGATFHRDIEIVDLRARDAGRGIGMLTNEPLLAKRMLL